MQTDLVTLSLFSSDPDGSKNVKVEETLTIPWGKLPEIVTDRNWSPSIYTQPYRCLKNYKGHPHLMAFDIDAGMTLEEAKKAFKDYQCIIATSRSHQKIKKQGTASEQPACDRFRVILKLARPITSDEEFKETWHTYRKLYPLDDQTCSSSMFFFKCTELVYNNPFGLSLPVIEPKIVEETYRFSPDPDNTARGLISRKSQDFLSNGAPEGAWNGRLFNCAVDHLEQLYSQEEFLARFNSMVSQGVCSEADAHDLATITSAFNRKPKYEPRTEKTKKKQLNEKKIAQVVLESFDGKLIRQEKALFHYQGQFWQEVDGIHIDAIKNRINSTCGDLLKANEVDSIYKTFFRYVPPVQDGVNLFIPSPAHVNFANGTLHIKRDLLSGVYSKEFLPHKMTDFVTWVVPIDYEPDPAKRTMRNPKFDALLDEAFKGDPDEAGKRRSIQELAGALMMPTFPQIAFLHGVSGARKSTIIKSLLKPLQVGGFTNVTFLDPSVMENFHIAAMIGKLVNANTDIDDHATLPRGFLKRFEDALPFPVNRKGKDVVHATLPAVHVYCCNQLPKNYEGSSKAFRRRLSLVEFTRDVTHEPGSAAIIKFYEDLVYQESPDGIHNFIFDGMDMLIRQGGRFTASVSGLAGLEEWQSDNDPIGRFFFELKSETSGDILDGNNRVIVHPGAEIKQKNFWEVFKTWHCGVFNKDPGVSRYKFYKRVRNETSLKIGKKILDGYDYFTGVGIEPGKDAVC